MMPILKAARDFHEGRVSATRPGTDLVRAAIAKALAPDMGEASLYAEGLQPATHQTRPARQAGVRARPSRKFSTR
jgi:hypothetical protein